MLGIVCYCMYVKKYIKLNLLWLQVNMENTLSLQKQ